MYIDLYFMFCYERYFYERYNSLANNFYEMEEKVVNKLQNDTNINDISICYENLTAS